MNVRFSALVLLLLIAQLVSGNHRWYEQKLLPGALTGGACMSPACCSATFNVNHGLINNKVDVRAFGKTDPHVSRVDLTIGITHPLGTRVALSDAQTNAVKGGVQALFRDDGIPWLQYTQAAAGSADARDVIVAPQGSLASIGALSATGTWTFDVCINADCALAPVDTLESFESLPETSCPFGNVGTCCNIPTLPTGWYHGGPNPTYRNHFIAEAGTTTSSSTGPPSAFSGNIYMYTETSRSSNSNCPFANTNNIAAEMHVCYDTSANPSGTFSLSFAYHMYGTNQGTFRVRQLVGDVGCTTPLVYDTLLFSRDGDQGNSWFTHTATGLSPGGRARMCFQFASARSGTSFRGDFALDAIQLTTTAVGPSPAPTPSPQAGVALQIIAQGQPTKAPTVTPGAPSKAPTTRMPTTAPTKAPTVSPLEQSVAQFPNLDMTTCCGSPCTVTLPALGKNATTQDVRLGIAMAISDRDDVAIDLLPPATTGISSHNVVNGDGGTGNNWNTLFDDTGSSLGSWTSQSQTMPPSAAPYVNVVQPRNSFSAFAGVDPIGVWQVRFTMLTCNPGTLQSVNLRVVGPEVFPPAATSLPTQAPTHVPSTTPTMAPTQAPSMSPTTTPTQAPSSTPTQAPSKTPTQAPSKAPTMTPTASPTVTPGAPSKAPTTKTPTTTPTQAPSKSPTVAPSQAPSVSPTLAPSVNPTMAPTQAPSVNPTQAPSSTPTTSPTRAPSKTPTKAPSKTPTKAPTQAPSWYPTTSPTVTPGAPTNAPTTKTPTVAPSRAPSKAPTPEATESPSPMPTPVPPTPAPSKSPTPAPSKAPSRSPTPQPTPAPLIYKVCDETTQDNCFCGSAFDCQCRMAGQHCNCENAITCNCSNVGGVCFGGNAQNVHSPGIGGGVDVDCQNAVVCQPVTANRAGLSGGAIGGIVAGVIVLIVVIVIVLICLLRKGAKEAFISKMRTGRPRGQSKGAGDLVYDD